MYVHIGITRRYKIEAEQNKLIWQILLVITRHYLALIPSFDLSFIALFYKIKLTTHCLRNWATHRATSGWTGLKLPVSQHTMTHNRDSKLSWRWHWLRPWLGCSTIAGSSSSWQKLNPLSLLLTSLCDGSTRQGWEGWGTTILIRAPIQRMLVASCQIQTLSKPFCSSTPHHHLHLNLYSQAVPSYQTSPLRGVSPGFDSSKIKSTTLTAWVQCVSAVLM